MSNVKIEVNYKGVGALLRGSEVREMVDSIGAGIAARAGDGYGKRTHYTKQRSICNVFADSKEAKQDNLEHNTLLKAMGTSERRSR